MKKLLCSAAQLLLALSPAHADDVALMQIKIGKEKALRPVAIEFHEAGAPRTVANFKKLAKDGFYNGTAFHRIIKDFMIQGGDPLTKDPANEARFGTGDPGYKIKAEFSTKPHDKGVLSMARGGDPDSAGSQFFICTGSAESPGLQNLNGKYAAFGKLIKGEDTLEKIANTPVTSNRGERSKPTERVTLESVTIVPADQVK